MLQKQQKYGGKAKGDHVNVAFTLNSDVYTFALQKKCNSDIFELKVFNDFFNYTELQRIFFSLNTFLQIFYSTGKIVDKYAII